MRERVLRLLVVIIFCVRVVGVRGFGYVSVFVVFISTALVLDVATQLFWTADSFCNIS